jgi:hypothetical protein
MIYDVEIGGESMLTEHDLTLKEFNVEPPEPVLKQRKIPGSSNIIDTTETLSGDIEYKTREMQMVFMSFCGTELFLSKYSKLMNFLHGQSLPIIPSWDAGFYYTGRLTVAGYKSQYYGGDISIIGIVEPFKLERFASDEDWEWDSFSFTDGIIRDYKDLIVSGTRELTITGRRKKVCPVFTCSAAMTVTYLGIVYDLIAGDTIVPEIYLGIGDHVLTFTGTGIVSVDYRGGML